MIRKSSAEARKGAAVAEFAVVLPLLAFIFVITYDWSRIFYSSQTIQNAARNGALYASDPIYRAQSQYTSLNEAVKADCASLSPAVQDSEITSQIVTSNGVQYAEVTINYTFTTVTNFPGVPTSTQLARTSRMAIAPTTAN